MCGDWLNWSTRRTRELVFESCSSSGMSTTRLNENVGWGHCKWMLYRMTGKIEVEMEVFMASRPGLR